MRTMILKAPGGLENFLLVERDVPRPGPGEILVRIRALSLNYHDYMVALGTARVADGRIPMSDGAGEVIEVGSGVTGFAPGDAVVSTFFPDWLGGEPTPATRHAMGGDTVDGYASEYVAASATAFTRAPAGWSHIEAATLTCAALTAWRGLVTDGRIRSGDVVLTQGTGGVSLFALQFAKAAGATVIATSSSDEKLDRLRAMGADHVINYRDTPRWGAEAMRLTGGRGVDHVVEIGGAGTLRQSIDACRLGGHIALIGILAGMSGDIPTYLIFGRQLRISGVTVSHRQDQEAMIRAFNATGMRPVVDSVFPLDRLADAYRHQASQKHFGKICIEV